MPKNAAKPKSLRQLYRKDASLMEDGVWVELKLGGVFMKLRSVKSDRYLKTLQRLQEEVIARQKRKPGEKPKKFTKEEELELYVRSVCEGLIVDWDGVVDDDGNPMKFTPEVALELFDPENIKEMEDLLEEIWGYVQMSELYRQDLFEQEVKNSPKPSDGS